VHLIPHGSVGLYESASELYLDWFSCFAKLTGVTNTRARTQKGNNNISDG